MSEENLQVVRASFDAFSRGDLRAMLELADPNVVFTEVAHWMGRLFPEFFWDHAEALETLGLSE